MTTLSKNTATNATKTNAVEDFLPTPELRNLIRQAEHDEMMAPTPGAKVAAQSRIDNLCEELGRRGEN